MSNAIGKTCPYCQTPIKPGEPVVFCSACSIPHHRQCWNEGRGCTTFGCSGNPAVDHSNRYGRTNTPVVDIDVDYFDTQYCSNCGFAKHPQAVYCSRCGAVFGDIDTSENVHTSASSQNRSLGALLALLGMVIMGVLIFFAISGESGSEESTRVQKAESLKHQSEIIAEEIFDEPAAEPADQEIIDLLTNAYNQLYEVKTAAHRSASDNRIEFAGKVYYTLPDIYGSREKLAKYYSEYWDDEAIDLILNTTCYVTDKYSCPDYAFGRWTYWDTARAVTTNRPTDTELQVMVNAVGIDRRVYRNECILSFKDNKWKVSYAPILDIFPTEPYPDVVSIEWQRGTFVGFLHNNQPDDYGIFNRQLIIDDQVFEQRMVGDFSIPDGVVYKNNQTIDDIRFEGEVIVTKNGTIPFAYFDGSNYDNSHFEGIFYFEFLKDLPPNARFEGYINSDGEFTGRFISGNTIESVSNIKINNANALLRI